MYKKSKDEKSQEQDNNTLKNKEKINNNNVKPANINSKNGGK